MLRMAGAQNSPGAKQPKRSMKMKQEELWDVLIVGAGAAGLTASIYAQRAGLRCLVLDKGTYGGQIATTNEIENYPAIERITGPELAQSIYRQAAAQGADIRFEEVTLASLLGTVKRLETANARYEGRTVVLANGAKRRRHGVPGEEEFAGRGVSYCATCDGAFFRGKTVAVCGGGNTALEDALYLANLCERVLLIHRRKDFTAERPLVEAALSRANIERRMERLVTAIEGSLTVSALRVEPTGSQRGGPPETLPVAGLFVAIGYEADNGLFGEEITLDESGYYQAGENCRTNIPGVFAAGDCRKKEVRQIITAAADGAVAAWQAGNSIARER